MRDPQVSRGFTTLAAATAGARATLTPYDRITGEVGAVRIRLTQPTGNTIGDVFADIYVGQNLVATNWAVPVEEYAGAGPNLRMPPINAKGGRGDVVSIVYRNADAANAVPAPGIQHFVEIVNFGR
jgi:hypothetical protein